MMGNVIMPQDDPEANLLRIVSDPARYAERIGQLQMQRLELERREEALFEKTKALAAREKRLAEFIASMG